MTGSSIHAWPASIRNHEGCTVQVPVSNSVVSAISSPNPDSPNKPDASTSRSRPGPAKADRHVDLSETGARQAALLRMGVVLG